MTLPSWQPLEYPPISTEPIMIEFDVQAMSCGHCVTAVTEAIKAVDPQAQVQVDLTAKKVRVESAEPRAELAAALTEAGYPPG